MANVQERVWLTYLMDMYGPLLTEHRRAVVRMYCEEDLSLGEIAEELSITRQGVSDTVNKARTQLESYESKLGLVKQDIALRESISRCLEALNSGNIPEATAELQQILKER